MNCKKRILFILTALNGGGAERVLINILRYFDYLHFEVDLCLLFNEGVFLNDVDERVHLFTIYPTTRSRKYWLDRIIYRSIGIDYFLRSRMRKAIIKNYDTIVSFAEGTSLQFHQFVFDKAERHITWVHIDMLVNHWTKYIFRNDDELRAYQHMHKIVFVSKDAQVAFNKLFPNINIEQCVIYNLIDTHLILEEAEKYTPTKRKFTIVAVGRLAIQKRFDRLINVCAMLKKNNYDVDTWIIGEGQLRPELQLQIQKLKLQDNVFLLGFKNSPYSYIKQADVLVSTSDSEGFSLVVSEAFVLGVPVVSTKTTGPVELLEGDKYGVLVDRDEFSIYNGIKLFIESDEQRKYYAQKSLERSLLFDIENTMNNIYIVIER